jgi:hypothetical protein
MAVLRISASREHCLRNAGPVQVCKESSELGRYYRQMW